MIRMVVLHIFQRRIGEECLPCIINKPPIQPLSSSPSMPCERVPNKPQVVQLAIINSTFEGLHILRWAWIPSFFLSQELYFIKVV